MRVSTTPAPPPFDAAPLTDPIEPGEAERFHRALLAANPLWARDERRSRVILMIAIAVGALFLLSALGNLVASALGVLPPDGPAAIVGAAALGVLMGGFLVVGGFIALRRLAGLPEWSLRLARFAAANGMEFVPRIDEPPLPGIIFRQGEKHVVADIIRGRQPRFVEFGNCTSISRRGRRHTASQWGYVAVQLRARQPHIVLDALGNNTIGVANLPELGDGARRVPLEGDLGARFALFAPPGNEAAARALFTPDLLARFVADEGELDVEIVDEWLFLYSRKAFRSTDPATWSWLFSVAAAVLGGVEAWERRAAGSVGTASSAASAQASSAGALPFTDPGVTRPPSRFPGDGNRVGAARDPWSRLRDRARWLTVVLAVALIGGAIALGWTVAAGLSG